MKRDAMQKLILIWAIWAITLFGFQEFVPNRIELKRPDFAREWTPSETKSDSQNNKPYLLDPFLNSHVSWDSEFYLSIAMKGYDDPQVRVYTTPDNEQISLNYAFFVLYPYLIRGLSYPIKFLSFTPLEAAVLGGILISLLGTLAAMLALYDLARDDLGEKGALRACFYLLVFPTGFFLAQVYTEGLFLALAFGSLALAHRKRFGWAAVLACSAVWCRPMGGLLVLPLIVYAWENAPLTNPDAFFTKDSLVKYGVSLTPILSFLLWKITPLANQFDKVEKGVFGHGFLWISNSIQSFNSALKWAQIQPQGAAYFALEMGLVLLALTTGVFLLRRYPALALFSLGSLFISLSSGSLQSISRYILAMPVVFVGLSKFGENEVFDRGWTLISILLMGLLTTLFTFDMWVA